MANKGDIVIIASTVTDTYWNGLRRTNRAATRYKKEMRDETMERRREKGWI